MAPVYALMISFGFAFILGAALDRPDRPNTPTRIRFVIAEQSGLSEPATELMGRNVEVFAGKNFAEKDRKSLANGPLDKSGEFMLPTRGDDIRICAELPKDKFAVDPKLTEVSGRPCWPRNARGEDIVITLVRKA